MNKKTTHSIQDLYGLIQEKSDLMTKATTITEQKKLRAEILRLEKHINDCNGKHLSERKIPEREVPKDISKKELLALIDEVPDGIKKETFVYKCDLPQLDLTGVHISDDRTEEFPRTSILEGKYLPT